MKISKKSIFGHILILLGLILLTSPLILRSYHDYSARAAKRDFETFEDARSDEEMAEENAKAQDYNELIKNSDITVQDPFTTEDYQNDYGLFTKTNTPFAYLSIPKLDKYLPIYLDATNEHLSRGVAQVAGTAIPIGGPGTRSALAGHRGWWGDTMFLYVDELEAGDYIYIERAESTMRYVVSDKEVIGPYDWDKLAPRGNADMISLLTCSPFLPPRPDRLLVNAIRDESAGPAGEFDLPTEKLPASQNSDETYSLVKITRIATLLGAVIGTFAFVYVLVRLVKKIRG